MEIPQIDARGLLCPLPVLKLRKALQQVAPGAQVALLADDPAAVIDVPHFCAEGGHVLCSSQADGAEVLYVVQRGESPKLA